MTSFDRREEAFEAKFAHDEERAFKARATGVADAGIVGRRKTRRDGERRRRLRASLDRGRYRDARMPPFDKLVLDLAAHGVDSKKIREKRDALFAIVQSVSA